MSVGTIVKLHSDISWKHYLVMERRPRFVLTDCQMEALQQRHFNWSAMARTLRVPYHTISRRRHELGIAVGERFSLISDAELDERAAAVVRRVYNEPCPNSVWYVHCIKRKMELCCIVYVFPVLVWCNVSKHNGWVKGHNTTCCVGKKSKSAGFTALSMTWGFFFGYSGFPPSPKSTPSQKHLAWMLAKNVRMSTNCGHS